MNLVLKLKNKIKKHRIFPMLFIMIKLSTLKIETIFQPFF